MKRNLTKKQKLFFSIAIIVIFIALVCYFISVIINNISKNNFIKQAVEISSANESPVFKIDKILLFSSAHAEDNTEEKSLKDLNISQYTDISIKIDNKSYISELTQENTVKALRIEDIELTSNQSTGIKSLTYKNPYKLGTYGTTDASEGYDSTDTTIKCAPIDFEIINTNNEQIDFDKPNFFTDCSNIICLGYINKDIVTHYSLPDNNNISDTGILLNQTHVDLKSLATNINFKIVIKNNLDENFEYNVKLNLNLDENSGITTTGYSFQGRSGSESNANNFFKDI